MESRKETLCPRSDVVPLSVTAGASVVVSPQPAEDTVIEGVSIFGATSVGGDTTNDLSHSNSR